MSNKKYDEDQVVRQLNLKQDIRIDSQQGVITILMMPHAKCDIGIKSKGKIDFLVHHRNYQLFWTQKF